MSRAIYRARWVVPVDAAPIENGCVVVEDGLIVEVGALKRGGEMRDFGDAIIMPGFINAHTHLEYTALRGFLEDVPFFPWVRALTALKPQIDQNGWLTSARLGVIESISAGVTTIGDNTDAGVTARAASESGLRGVIFQELFGIDDREPVEPIVAELRRKLHAHAQYVSDRVRLGVSPHALYTIRPALFDALALDDVAGTLPWSIHIAESPAESRLTETGTGPFFEMYARRGITWDCPRVTPTEYAGRVGALRPRTLAVHCVHQTPSDIALLAASGSAVVHCPKSNGKLGAGTAPLDAWLRTPELCVALGTDSAVSNNTLDMFEEMRFAVLTQRAARESVECVSARDVIEMATLGGARALRISDATGSLTAGKRADMIVVNLSAPHALPASDPYAAVVYSACASDVVFTMCDGVVLYDCGAWATVEAENTVKEARALRRDLEAKQSQ